MNSNTTTTRNQHFIAPIIAGNERQSSRCGSTDGIISSAVSFSCLIAISIAIVIGYDWEEKYNNTAKIIIWLGVMVPVCIGFSCLIVLSLLIVKSRSDWLEAIPSVVESSTKLKVVSLWIFGLGIILHTSIDIATNIYCLPRDNKVYESLSILSNVTFILFLALQMCFVTYLHRSRFVCCVTVNYCMMFIVISNICVWLNITFRYIYGIYIPPDVINITHTTPASLDATCFWKSSIHKLLSHVIPYLIPIRMEFSLLATAFIFGMWPGFQNDDNQEMLRSENAEVIHNDNNHNEISFTVLVSTLIGILINIPNIIVTALFVFVYGTNNKHLFAAWEICCCMYGIVYVIFILLGFHIVSDYSYIRETKMKLKANEYILVLSAGGKVAFNTFGLISGTVTQISFGSIVPLRKIMIFVGSFLQTILIINAKRYKRIANRGRQLSVAVFRILFICNLFIWFNGTFVGFRGTAISEGEDILLGKNMWTIVDHIFYPFVIFFHFHSAMDFYTLYCRYKEL